jgi:uncharacterized protein YggE
MNVRIPRFALALTAAAVVAALGATVLLTRGAAARGAVGAPSRASAPAHSITVNGHGDIMVAPDMALVTFGVETRAEDAAAASQNNAAKISAVISAVEAQGVAADHIQTANLSLYFDDQRGEYIADHQITVRIDSLSKAGAIIDAAVGAGANNSWGISFGLKNPSAARAQALQAAVTDGRTHADAIAGALGVTISGISSASEPSYSGPVYETGAPKAAGAPSVPTPVQPGQLDVTADVTIVYTFG